VFADALVDNFTCVHGLVKELQMRSIILLLLGVPLPIVILIALFSH
jgi:hypothetical protein